MARKTKWFRWLTKGAALTMAAILALSCVGSALAAETKNWKFMSDYPNRDDAFAAAEAVEIQMNEEGMILLKNQYNALPIAKDAAITVFLPAISSLREVTTSSPSCS